MEYRRWVPHELATNEELDKHVHYLNEKLFLNNSHSLNKKTRVGADTHGRGRDATLQVYSDGGLSQVDQTTFETYYGEEGHLHEAMVHGWLIANSVHHPGVPKGYRNVRVAKRLLHVLKNKLAGQQPSSLRMGSVVMHMLEEFVKSTEDT